MRRRDLLFAAPAAMLAPAACRPGDDGRTVSPDELPPPAPPKMPPDAFAIVGHGATLTLRRPVHVLRLDDAGDRVRIESGAGAPAILTLHRGGPDDEAPADAALKVGAQAWLEADPDAELAELAEAAAGPDGPWRLRAGAATFDWPAKLRADAFVGDIARVELRRERDPRDVMVIIRGPLPAADVPSLAELAGPGQDVEALAPDATPPSIELRYRLGDDLWRQRHYRVELGERILLVTAQAMEELAERVLDDGARVAQSAAPAPATAGSDPPPPR